MAHVELSLSEVRVPTVVAPTEQEYDNVTSWSVAVSQADEPCLLIAADTRVVAVSAAGSQLLFLGDCRDLIGQPLLDGSLRLLDFTANRGELTEPELDKIPPLLAITSGRLARGLLRIKGVSAGAPDATVDAISTPVHHAGVVVGSLTFFSEV